MPVSFNLRTELNLIIAYLFMNQKEKTINGWLSIISLLIQRDYC